jgi:hypothetical protein
MSMSVLCRLTVEVFCRFLMVGDWSISCLMMFGRLWKSMLVLFDFMRSGGNVRLSYLRGMDGEDILSFMLSSLMARPAVCKVRMSVRCVVSRLKRLILVSRSCLRVSMDLLERMEDWSYSSSTMIVSVSRATWLSFLSCSVCVFWDRLMER